MVDLKLLDFVVVVEVSAVSSQEFGLQFDQLTQIIRSVHSKSAIKKNEKEIMLEHEISRTNITDQFQ